MQYKHSAIRRFALGLESLSDRIVPSCTWVEEDGILTITGDQRANTVDIVDDGTTLTITCDGEEIELTGEVNNIVIGLGLYTSGANPLAVAALWKAGARS